MVRRMNRWSLKHTYRRLVAEYDIKSPIIFATVPAAVDLLGAVHDGLTVYYCVDNWTEYPGLNAATGGSWKMSFLPSLTAWW